MDNPINDNQTIHERVEAFYSSDFVYVSDYMEKAIAHFAERKIDRWEVAARLGDNILELLNGGTVKPTILLCPSIVHDVKMPRLFGDDATIESDVVSLNVIRRQLDKEIQMLVAEQERRARERYLKECSGQLTDHFTKADDEVAGVVIV